MTVLLCTHNDADLLREAVLSVTRQTVKVREILILDDGTTSETHVGLIDELASAPNVRLIRVNNMGLVAGRNLLVENARTELVIFLDADDRLAPTFVEKTLAAMNLDPANWSAVITRRKNFGNNDHEIQYLLLDTPAHWVFNDLRMTALIRRDVLERLRFDPGIRNGEADDWWWWLNFSLHGYKANFVPEPLFFYRTASNSMSVPWSHGQGALTVELLKRCATAAGGDRPELTEAMQWLIMAAYKNKWEHDQSQVRDSSADQKQASLDRALRPAVALLGPERAGIVLDLGRRVVRRHPLLRRAAHATLRRLFPPIDSP